MYVAGIEYPTGWSGGGGFSRDLIAAEIPFVRGQGSCSSAQSSCRSEAIFRFANRQMSPVVNLRSIPDLLDLGIAHPRTASLGRNGNVPLIDIDSAAQTQKLGIECLLSAIHGSVPSTTGRPVLEYEILEISRTRG